MDATDRLLNTWSARYAEQPGNDPQPVDDGRAHYVEATLGAAATPHVVTRCGKEMATKTAAGALGVALPSAPKCEVCDAPMDDQAPAAG